MTETIGRLKRINERHQMLTRNMTWWLSALVCSVGFALWGLKVPLLDEYKLLVGLVLMILAVVYYKIPHLAFLMNRRHYSTDAVMLDLMGDTWEQYKKRLFL